MELRAGPLGFRPLQKRCDDMSSSVMRQRLTELLDAQVIDQLPDSRYELTPLGQEARHALNPLARWRDAGRPLSTRKGRTSPTTSPPAASTSTWPRQHPLPRRPPARPKQSPSPAPVVAPTGPPPRVVCHAVAAGSCSAIADAALAAAADPGLAWPTEIDVWASLLCGSVFDCPPDRLTGRRAAGSAVVVAGTIRLWVNVLEPAVGSSQTALDAWVIHSGPVG